ncbi:adenylate/guanylate cyclase domain-containing protein [Variovorax sp. J22R133]|uniref:adenylate/guanylate cyclase domain-containing protein n=1 Tax=Variovorax brevis TaxID=3053503 RepID=UPI0025784713|nr:adenylate/guanylate cyclase domain-containing protein [Variovorax sp. J22R133]MDM0116637.1 adenylate/guanylate cyclase domain-containing protein [Variovorax sp. J22R133]
MPFSEVVERTIEWLRRDGRVSYAALKREFEIDDGFVDDLKTELIDAKRLAEDENGRVLVWRTGEGVALGGDDGERRQLTVMFCDLVGSTALSQRLDPEDLREVVRAYQRTCVEVIERYEGNVAQYLGDGLLVYFGFPRAHEDDAQRAAEAGLQMIEALQALSAKSHQPIHARIGIHTGLVVIGEMGAGGRRDLLALGDTPNIAARVQGTAAPDTVIVSATTYRLISGLFDGQDLGPHDLKGLAAPVRLHRLLAHSGARSRFEAAARTRLTPLVGREHESATLRAAWRRVLEGAGHAVLIAGEAGIGKSRLAREARDEALLAGATCIEFGCSPYHRNSALFPVIGGLQRLLQFASTDTPAEKLVKLGNALAKHRLHDPETLALLARFLSVPAPSDALTALSGQKQREKTSESLLRWIEAESVTAGLCNIWQDLHWADPSTLELFTQLLDRLPRARILALTTFRPDFSPPWQDAQTVTCLALGRLERAHVEAMVAELTGGRRLPEEVMRELVLKTDGVPLFMEELAKMVIGSDMLVESDEGFALVGLPGPLSIPDTLQDSLMARLDRLAPVRELAQIAATLGRDFSHLLIRAVTRMSDSALDDSLWQLVGAGLIDRRDDGTGVFYSFKHALVQESAYQSQLKSARRQRHQNVAWVLEQQFPEVCATQPEVLAHHYTEGGQIHEAIAYWQRAGGYALSRAAHREAIHHLQHALSLLDLEPQTPERAQQELPLQTLLGAALLEIRGFAAPEVGMAFGRAEALCAQFGNGPALFPVLRGLYGFHLVTGEMERTQALADKLTALARETADSSQIVEGHHTQGIVACHRGDFARATEELERAVLVYDPSIHGAHSAAYGMDPAVSSLIYLGWLLSYAGFLDRGLQRSADAHALAMRLGTPFNIAYALMGRAMAHLRRGEPIEVQRQADACIALSAEQGFPHWLAWGNILRGWAIAQQGQAAEAGIQEIRQGLALHQTIGTRVSHPTTLGLLAQACLAAGDTAAGLEVVDEGLGEVADRGEAWWHSELLRTRGQLLAAGTELQWQAAGQCYQEGIGVARRQGALYLELGNAIGLSRVLHAQGQVDQARRLLIPLHGKFVEGRATVLIREGAALLQ